ncbi:MAG: Protein of unknown function transrane [Edaphobacter sp.]|nr:Protein of unknown function transrane [Edaphobacter sp.]
MPLQFHSLRVGGTVVAMGQGENQDQPDRYGNEVKLAAELAALSIRVETLERELASLRASMKPLPASTPDLDVVPQPAIPETSSVPPAQSVPVAPPPWIPPPMTSPVLPPSLENKLGAQVFNRVGVVALLIGVTWFLKLAMDNHWIGPVGRILAGLIAGAGVILWSERFRQKGFNVFSYSLKAIGSGVLYLSLWAAFQLYHLLPAGAALGAMILVTAWNAYMAWAQDSELLAAYALAGGFATPLLLSTGGNHEIFLFTYLLAMDIATVVLVRLKPWPRLLLAAFPATVVYFIGWYVQFYSRDAFSFTSIFIVLFFFVFVSVPLGMLSRSDVHANSGGPIRPKRLHALIAFIPEVLLPLGSAAFVSLALYSVLEDAGHHAFLPWLMVLLAVAYLGIMRLPQGRVSAALHLSLAVVFLTIAIPLKASGHWITVAWFVEGVALLWVSIHLAAPTPADESTTSAADPSSVLRWLASAALLLGLGGLFSVAFWFDASLHRNFLNADFATAIIGIAAFASAVWLSFRAHRQSSVASATWTRLALACIVAIDVVGVLLCLREIAPTSNNPAFHPAFLNADFATALTGIATLAVSAWFSLRHARRDVSLLWLQLAGTSIIAINLIALLVGVREIDALWYNPISNPEGDLQKALAISAFLMLYGGVLLAIGFWKRTAFIRWQALTLIVFTIAKTFLYDMRNLSQGYRVVSFLCLGALLMAISFAYQKDWLALRTPVPRADAGHSEEEGQ